MKWKKILIFPLFLQILNVRFAIDNYLGDGVLFARIGLGWRCFHSWWSLVVNFYSLWYSILKRLDLVNN